MQQNPNYIDAKDVLEATNGGLDIILYLYPQAVGSDTDRRKKFKIREGEKSASANIHKATDGNWLVTDFGGDQQPRNGIQCYVLERNVEFVTALRELAAQFNVISQEQAQLVIRADYSERPAEPDEKEGTWSWEVKKQGLENIDILTIISKKVLEHVGWNDDKEAKRKQAYQDISDIFQKYRWHALANYSLVKDRRVMIFSSTETYPVFLIDEGAHQKLYQPLHPDKSKRFMYIGTKPKDFIHGLDQLKQMFTKRKNDIVEKKNEKKQAEDRQAIVSESTSLAESDDIGQSIDKEAKISEAILCSGGSDALNVALMGYIVLWLNSETAKLPGSQYKAIMDCIVKLYQLQDIDNTGVVSAHNLAMKYLDIYTIQLPEELKKNKDRRGNPCKDVRDYFNYYDKKAFATQLRIALPYRFWEKKPIYEGRGEDRKFVGHRYDFNNIHANNFLMKNGFGRYKIGNTDSDWIYVKRTGNIVKEVDADTVQDFIHDFLEERHMDTDLRNAMVTTSKLNSNTLAKLKRVAIEFEDHTADSQFYFFSNRSVEVTKDEILYHKPGIIDRYIWEEDKIDHNITPLEQSPFTITKDEFGKYDIEIHDKECLFLKFLIQVSRIHWRDELEQGINWKALTPDEQHAYREKYHCAIDGPNLSEEQIDEQKLHLVNKLFAIGYMLHRYKDPTKGWFPYAMDGKLSDDGRSHGGSGKSILMSRSVSHFLRNRWLLNGRNKEILEDRFKYDAISTKVRQIYVDDAHEYTNIGGFFVDITEDLSAPQKGKATLIIPFAKSPKLAFSSNFPPKNPDSSIERRIIYVVFSDYYHNKGENDDYLEQRDPKNDLGTTLFIGFEKPGFEGQYNRFFNTMLHALKFYLSTDEKISPAMDNVNKRTLLAEMGTTGFQAWADAYFAQGNGHVDRYVVREYAFEAYKFVTKDNKLTPNAFKKRIKAYCQYNGYKLNPKELTDKKGMIMQKTTLMYMDKQTGAWYPIQDAKKETKELLYIQTCEKYPDNLHIGFPEEPDAPEDEPESKTKIDF